MRYDCGNTLRRDAVRDARDSNGKPVLNGIDYLEVGSGDQKTLKLYFIHPVSGADSVPSPSPDLSKDNFLIEGGVRIRNIRVAKAWVADENILEIQVYMAGDFSLYTLQLTKSADDPAPPSGFDPLLAKIDFSFKATCPTEFDCQAKEPQWHHRGEPAPIHYLAKDFASFRQLMLDRLSVLLPDWKERNPADLGIALVELLAYIGDHLSYRQDAVATEAYLATARRRVSLRRHARLVDYVIHDGCNARTWLCFEVDKGQGADGASVPKQTPVLTKTATGATTVDPDPDKLNRLINSENPVVFETLYDITLRSSHDRIGFYSWSNSACCLPKGTTRATLRNSPPLSFTQDDIEKGVYLLFEEIRNPVTGAEADADSTRRHAVRLASFESKTGGSDLTDPLTGENIAEITWHEEDALPFPLYTSVYDEKEAIWLDYAVARGNVVLADHGRTIRREPLIPEKVPEQGPYYPSLSRRPLCCAAPFDPTQSARSALAADARSAKPVIELDGAGQTWVCRYDLLASDKFSPEFVAESEADGTVRLRFGDNVTGRAPAANGTFTATYRVGNGTAGNVGAGALACIAWAGSGISRIWNPLAAAGGTDPETMDEIRISAPQAFRRQERAVTEADYAEVSLRHPGVQRAVATFRWTGSWHTVFLTIDRKGGKDIDAAFERSMQSHLENFRMAGCDLEIDAPAYVPLDISMTAFTKAGYFRSSVKQALLDAFGTRETADGRPGFFHPDRFTFGQPVYLSELYKAAMEVEGVEWVEVTRFKRWGKTAAKEIDNGVLPAGRTEVIRLDNDPNFPENGRIEFEMKGGL